MSRRGRNRACAFCREAHAAAAGELGDHDLVRSVLGDLERSPIDERTKVLLRFIAGVTRNLPAIGGADVDAVRAAGWDD